MSYKPYLFPGGAAPNPATAANTGFYFIQAPSPGSEVFDAASGSGTALGLLQVTSTANTSFTNRILFNAANLETEIRIGFTIETTAPAAEMRMGIPRSGANAATNSGVSVAKDTSNRVKMYDATSPTNQQLLVSTSPLPAGEYEANIHCIVNPTTATAGRMIIKLYNKGSNTVLYTGDSNSIGNWNLGTAAYSGWDWGLLTPTTTTHTNRIPSPQLSDGPAIGLTAIAAPTASLAVTPTALTVAADATGSHVNTTGTTLTYDFNWGDGTAHTTGTNATPGHTYAAAGTYTVTVLVTDSNNLGASTTQNVTVSIAVAGPFPIAANVFVDGTLYNEAYWHTHVFDPIDIAVSALEGDSGWVALTLQNSWTYYGSPFATPAYRLRYGGLVELRGLIKNATSSTATIAVLPYPPSGGNLIFSSLGIEFLLDTSGNLSVHGYNSGITAATVPLDQCSFWIA